MLKTDFWNSENYKKLGIKIILPKLMNMKNALLFIIIYVMLQNILICLTFL